MKRAVRAIVFRDNMLLVIKRNKFGKQYFTLPGGGINLGETPAQALRREMQEETGLELGDARPVFVDEQPEPYGTQFVYLMDYLNGEPTLSPASGEASINQLGRNTYEPVWLPITELAASNFVSERLKKAIVNAIYNGFPTNVIELS